jgi:hypothetical protein
MNKQTILTSAWAALVVYFLVASIIVTAIAAMGLENMDQESLDKLSSVFISYEAMYIILVMQPTLIVAILFSLMFLDINFSLGVFKKGKKKDE